MDGDSDFENVFDNPFVIGELHVSGKLFGKHGGNYRFNVWLNESDHQHITVPNRIREEGYGFGMSFDQQMSDVIALFARFGWQDDDVYPLEASWSAGFEIKGAPWGREEDNLGLAFAQGIANKALPALEDEFRLEVYYSFVINKNVIISPDLQMLFNPAGDRALDNVVVLGVRTQIFF